MKEILDYLSRLRENNNREWFQAHKEEYDRLRPLFVEKIQELIQQISQFDEDIVGLEAKNCRSEERRVGKECRSRWSPYH